MMTAKGAYSKSKAQEISETPFITGTTCKEFNFVAIFPPELSDKLFTYVSDKDLFSCSGCCIDWQRIINNNTQWKMRCIRRGWITITNTNEKRNSEKWNLVKSHISKDKFFKFRKSPVFYLNSVSGLRIPQLCKWGLYYRQCLKLQWNWSKGIYGIHRMTVTDEEVYEPMVITATDCNGNILATGTNAGQVLLWSVEGVPSYIKCIWPMCRRFEVEAIRVTQKYLVVLYNTGLIKIFNAQKDFIARDYRFDLFYQIRGVGSYCPDRLECRISTEYVTTDSIQPENRSENYGDLELWIRDLFSGEFWSRNEDSGSEMMIHVNEDYVVLTALLCKSFILWDIHSGTLRKKFFLKPGFQVIFQSYLTSRKFYISTRKRGDEDSFKFSLLVYDIHEMETAEKEKCLKISSDSIIEETRADSKDERIVFATQDSRVHGISLMDKTVLFTKVVPSSVNNLAVSDSCIVYHKYIGCLVGLNWDGKTLFEIEAHIGLVRGLKHVGNFLVSGGDAMELYVWDATTGKKLHAVHHQPCRIQFLHVDETKVVTVGKEDHPVLIGYW